MSTKLYVGNLPETCRKIDLETVFAKYGTVVECDIVQNFAFVVRSSIFKVVDIIPKC